MRLRTCGSTSVTSEASLPDAVPAHQDPEPSVRRLVYRLVQVSEMLPQRRPGRQEREVSTALRDA
jgi:hypothetical protein